ncbi:MAG: peptidylprolyl isomerase [Flavobacteriales bacterium]|nr:peptidylprolyl isomerase [Flavobacteriales bacterium]
MIQQIRDRSTLLMVVIGVGMALFIGGDFFSSGNGPFGNTGETDVLIVDGRAVSNQEFQQRINTQIGSNPAGQNQREQVSNAVWSQLISEFVLGGEYDKLGLNITGDELFARIRAGASQILQQQFTGRDGRVDPNFADQFGRLDGNKVLAAVKQTMSNPDTEGQWLKLEKSLLQERYQAKYNTLIKKGIAITTAEAQAGIKDQGSRVSFSYILKQFDDVDDKSVEVTDADLEKYYNEHKHEAAYVQKQASRGVEYVAFQVNPSVEDIAAIQNELTDLKADFTEEVDDTSFVNENAETAYNIRYYNEGSFPVEIDSLIFSGDTGTVFGPFLNANTYQLAKIIGTKTTPDSANARHIMLRIVDGDTAKTKALADSLLAVINANDNFEELAPQFSQDLSSTPQGGNLDWFSEYTCPVPDKKFIDACFTGPVGQVQIIETAFGIHLVEVIEQTEPKAKKLIAIVDRPLVASSKTKDMVYNQASDFSIANSDVASFRAAGNKLGIRVADRVLETDRNIAGLENSRDLILWAFKSNVGDVADQVFEFGDKFVVAHLKEIREAGTLGLNVESVKQGIRLAVLNEKKAELISTEMNKYSSLKEASSAMGKEVEISENTTFSSYSVSGVGTETVLLGALFNLQVSQLSKPIVDRNGVYLVLVNGITPAAEGNVAVVKQQMTYSTAAQVDYTVANALQNSCEITDNRGKFF